MKVRIFAVISIIALLLVGCSGEAKISKTYTFSVTTGDKIKVSLDTTGGYDLFGTGEFVVTKDGEDILNGMFTTAEILSDYFVAVAEDEDATIIAEGDGWVFYNYKDMEYNRLVIVGNTGIIVGCAVSQEEAEKCWSKITIELQ